jgi:hypothetical protein
MARVAGVKEKLHMPLYDALYVAEPGSTTTVPTDLGTAIGTGNIARFFVDVQNKTRLDTNLQASGVLPSQNSYEARALRVVASPVTKAKKEDTHGVEFLEALIYNSVTTLLVGEKVMIEMPTFWFPAGAGVSVAAGNGWPDPTATFRFAEPVTIEPQQNFRVEMQFPLGVKNVKIPPFQVITTPATTPTTLAEVPGPFRIWVILDGYLTRDVQ